MGVDVDNGQPAPYHDHHWRQVVAQLGLSREQVGRPSPAESSQALEAAAAAADASPTHSNMMGAQHCSKFTCCTALALQPVGKHHDTLADIKQTSDAALSSPTGCCIRPSLM